MLGARGLSEAQAVSNQLEVSGGLSDDGLAVHHCDSLAVDGWALTSECVRAGSGCDVCIYISTPATAHACS
mgnify:CR=1 FL=1